MSNGHWQYEDVGELTTSLTAGSVGYTVTVERAPLGGAEGTWAVSIVLVSTWFTEGWNSQTEWYEAGFGWRSYVATGSNTAPSVALSGNTGGQVNFTIGHAYGYQTLVFILPTDEAIGGGPPDPEPVPGSASTIIPILIGGDIEGLPTDVVANTAPTDAVSSWDAAQDIADRSGVRLVDRGSGWEALPALPVPGDPVLHVEHTVNLISADSVVDIDQSDWAQSALVVYRWEDEYDPNPEDGEPGVPYTRRVIAWSYPQYGTDTMVEVRDGIPATEAQAQTVADVLGARAWLRGHSLEVVTTCCAWVRIGDTVRVTLPWADTADYWVAEARHDSPAATSTLTLRAFALTYYPTA